FAVDQVDCRVPFHKYDLFFELVLRPKIITVQERNVIATSVSDRQVPSRSRPSVGLGQYLDPRFEASGHTQSSVARPVVNDNDFVIAVSLIENAANGFGQELFGVIRRNDHAYLGHHTFYLVNNLKAAPTDVDNRAEKNRRLSIIRISERNLECE